MTTIKKPEWPFYGAWILLSVLSVPIAFVLSLLIMKLATMFVGDFIYVDSVPHITEDYLSSYCFVPLLGLVIGIAQYLLLRRYLPGMGWWVAATILGWCLGLLLIFGLRELMATFLPTCATAVTLAFLFNQNPPVELQSV